VSPGRALRPFLSMAALSREECTLIERSTDLAHGPSVPQGLNLADCVRLVFLNRHEADMRATWEGPGGKWIAETLKTKGATIMSFQRPTRGQSLSPWCR
jgi:hypothetical protein